MAYDHNKGSFDYKIIDERITKILDHRSELDNTVQLAMPFVKATTTIQHDILNQGDAGCVGFTLGLHAIKEDVRYEDIYSAQNGNAPLIGYTYREDGTTKRVYAINPFEENNDIVLKIFDRRAALFSNTKSPDGRDFIRIPPPGITKTTIGRNKNGLLASAQLEISIPSLLQLESLHRTFLVPGLGMVLEWGQQFAVESLTTNVTGELPDISYAMFPWHDRARLNELLRKLATNQLGLEEILDKYVYPSSGQYMWMFGRVANFNVKSNSDGSFNATVKIVGPSEDSWAYSTRNTVVPTKDASTKFFCASETNSVYSYFTETAAGALNFKTLLDKVKDGAILSEWKDHVQLFKQGNKKGGEPDAKETKPNVNSLSFADSEDAYFISWRFFVNVVLNDETFGIKALFKKITLDPNQLNKIGMLLPYAADEARLNKNVAGIAYLDDPEECFVGFNAYLRSIDPSALIIVNEQAAKLAKENPQYNMPSSTSELLRVTDDSNRFSRVGWFDKSASGYNPGTDPKKHDRGFLSTGVWLNHKAVVESMINGDTIIRGVSNLLERMNNATMGYWQLAVDVVEPKEGSTQSYNYRVIDVNHRDNSTNAVSKFIDKVHIFNKYVRVDNTTGNLVGSELIDCSVDLSLPKRLFSQIATMGLVQPEDLNNAGVAPTGSSEELNYSSPPKLSDPNDTLREMFAITTLSVKTGEKNPDLTILPKDDREQVLRASGICGKGNVQTTGKTGGVGDKPNDISIQETYKDKSAEELKKLQQEASASLANDACKKCETCSSPPTPTPSASTTPQSNKKLSQLTISEVQSVQRPRGSVLAVGKYQAIPATLKAWVSAQKIPTDTVFDSSAQEKLGDWLIVGKRPKVGRFVNGDPTVSIEDAQLELAKEFASIPVPYRVTRPPGAAGKMDPGAVLEAGQSYYYGVAGNRATASSAKYQEALRTARQNRNLQSLKEFIAKGEGNYDALNRGTAGDTSTYSTDYYTALNQRSPTPQSNSSTSTKECTDQEYLNISIASKPAGAYIGGLLGASAADGKEICKKCQRAKEVVSQVAVVSAETEKTQASVDKAVREFFHLQHVFRYVEVFPEYMVAQITDTADGNNANAFGASPGALSIAGDLTMPGINGLRVGQLFWIDRIPAFYKAFGAFQIMSIEDNISIDGWTTKVHAVFNYLGKAWKNAMIEKLKI